jgi:hypothetical protein
MTVKFIPTSNFYKLSLKLKVFNKFRVFGATSLYILGYTKGSVDQEKRPPIKHVTHFSKTPTKETSKIISTSLENYLTIGSILGYSAVSKQINFQKILLKFITV